MVEPKKKLREVLFHTYPLSYRIRQKALDSDTMDKKSFIEVIEGLKKIEDRKDFMESELGIDMTLYEEQFFDVIEGLFKLAFSEQQLSLIQMYLYTLVTNSEWDGNITITENNVEKVVPFKKPEDVWEVIKKFN